MSCCRSATVTFVFVSWSVLMFMIEGRGLRRVRGTTLLDGFWGLGECSYWVDGMSRVHSLPKDSSEKKVAGMTFTGSNKKLGDSFGFRRRIVDLSVHIFSGKRNDKPTIGWHPWVLLRIPSSQA